MITKSIAEIINELIDADRVKLPVHPRLAEQALACIDKEGCESKRLWTLVSNDPALLCELFRAANSSFYSGLPRTLTVQEAVTRLGFAQAVQIIRQSCQNQEGSPSGQLVPRYMPSIWLHAQSCAVGAKWLAIRCGYQGLAEQAFLAGLLHDIGKQYLLAALEEIGACGDYSLAISDQLAKEVIATMHVEQGLRLFEDWSLPDAYKDVVAEHHDDDLDKQNIVVALVKLANKGCRKIGLGLEHQPELVLPTTGEAQFLGIDEIALAEFEIMLEDKFLNGAVKAKE